MFTICCKPFGFHASKAFLDYLAFIEPDDGDSRKASCALNLITAILLFLLRKAIRTAFCTTTLITAAS
jgi:hypothetical protein